MKPAIVFDFETTGLLPHPNAPRDQFPRIIEFGAALVSTETGEILKTCQIIINPKIQIEPIITKITGLTNEDLAAHEPLEDALPAMREIFGAAGHMCAHNLPFDRGVLRNELIRLGVEDFPWPAAGTCTVEAYTPVWGRRPKLIELYEYVMERPLAQTHRALEDVNALVEIVVRDELYKEMKSDV